MVTHLEAIAALGDALDAIAARDEAGAFAAVPDPLGHGQLRTLDAAARYLLHRLEDRVIK